MHNAGLPHVVHTIVMEPKTVSTVRSIHEKFDVFTDAVRGEPRYQRMLTTMLTSVINMNIRVKRDSTYYFDSFSNIVFVSSSVRGLILATL